MLREIRDVRRTPGQPSCRWFNDELLDLFVWQDEDGRIIGFQLCFDKDADERALTYSEANGYLLEDVQAEESSLDMGSPVLANVSTLPFPRLLAQLAGRGAGIDSRVLRYVTEKLEAYTSLPAGSAPDS
ncbi:MAG TPA: hypothetical protein VGO96_02630 [Pyrinomonadaceae bacterium]|jgi:hypothetical protein|nr:hypothetical protein [Pyrinomonadaceae bacterium]